MRAMRLHILGCSGGLGGSSATSPGTPGTRPQRTSSFLLDHDILIDAGTGVEDLDIEAMAQIDHVFLSHSHLDHISALPLMLDTVGSIRAKPVTVHALPETIAALKAHIFNWIIWPDFTEIPHYDRPWMVFSPLEPHQPVRIGDRSIRPIPANHTVPAVGFHLSGPGGSIVYSGDTWPDEAFWRVVNGIPDLRYLIIETAFANRESDLAVTAKHLYPIELARQLDRMRVDARVLITHLKPSHRDLISREIDAWAGRFSPAILETGDIIRL